MKKFLKIVAIVAVVLIAVALVVPLALESKVGDIVKKEAGELLTAEVDFRSLDLSLLRHFPHASVELEGLTVVCAAPFEGDTLASVGRISVVVDLMSLFGDSGYEVTKLLVDKAHLHARKLADGSVNWDVMKPSDEPAEEKEPAEADEPSAFRLRMRDVRLSEAVVRYEDDSTGMRAGVDPLDLRLSGDLSGERSDLDLRLEAHRLSYAAGGVALLRDADLTADVTLDADLKNKRFTFSDNRLSLNAIALSLDGWVALADDRTEMDVRVNSSKVEFRDVLSLVPAFYTRDFENLTASGQLTLDAWAKGVLAGELLTAEVDFRSLDLSLLRHFPHASVELEGLTVVCAAPFEGDTLASVGRISVVVDLMSLFGDSGYEVTKLLVDKAHLHARKLADGSVNWDVMKPSDEPAEEKEPAEADEPSAFRLRMRDVRLSEAVVRYEDDSTGMRAGVDPLDLRLSGDLSGERSDLDLRLEAHRLSYAAGGVALLRDADLTADVTLDADLKNKRFTFSDNRLSLNAIALSLDGWVALADDRTEMDVRVNSSKVEFRDVLSLVPAFYTRDFENLTASGQLTLDAWAKGVLAGDRLPAFETTLAVRDGSFKYASLPKAVTGITIDARAANPGGTADATTVDVPTFALTMAGNALRGSFSAATPMSDLRFKAAAAGKVDLGAVKEVYPLGDSIALAGVVTADMQASGRMSDIERERYEAIAASGRLTVEGVTAALAGLPEVKVRRAAMSVSPAALTLSELGVTVGRSDIEASGTLSNYIGYLLRDQTLRGRLDVRSSLLDLNELLGDASEASADTGAAAAPADTAAMRAVVVPQNLDLALGASLKKILFQKMVLDDFTGSLTVAKGTVSMNRLAMNAFGGRMSASGSYSTAADAQRPALKLKAEIADASFSTTFDQLDVVRRMVPLFEKTGGDYSMSLDLATRLTQTMDPDYATLQADGAIRSKNIRVQNIAVFDQLAAALKNDALRRIEAKDVDIRFTIRDGRIATQPFDLSVGGISLNLSGSTGLDQTIDYTARVTLPEGSAGGILTAVDVGIGGSFSSPKITLDVKNAVKDAVSNAIGEKLGLSVGSSEGKSADEIRADAKAKGDKLVEEARAQRDKLVGKASGKLARIAAQASGDALVSAAEKQAQKLMEQAEQQIAAQQQ